MEVNVIIEQIIILGLLIFIGSIGRWTSVIRQNVKDSIAKLVFNITLPLLIVTTFSNLEITKAILENGLWMFIFTNLSIGLFYIVAKITCRIFNLSIAKENVHLVHTMFGNVVFLGFPLIDSLYPGGEALFYAAICHLIVNFYVWTFGIYIFNKHKVSIGSGLKHLINPNTVAFIIGITMMMLNIEFPEIVYNSLYGMGDTTIYLSMLYIGSVLVDIKIRGILQRKDLFVLSLNKLLLIPIVLFFIVDVCIRFLGISFGDMAITILILEAGMPSMTIIVILAKQYGSDDMAAIENVFVTTILSIITLPLLYVITTSML